MKKSRIARTLLACTLFLTTQAEMVDAQVNPTTEVTRIEKIKKRLSESSKDPKSRVEVCLKDKRRVTGQLGEMRDDGFILTESPSDRPLLIAYQDVAKITDKGPSAFTKFGLAALIGGTALLTVVAIVAGANSAVACLLNTQLTSAWAGDNFWTSQLVIELGLSFTFVALVGSLVQSLFETGALANPSDVLTFSAFIHCVRIFGGEAGSSFMQHFIAVREKFHSNLIGLHIEAGNWLTDERLRWLTGGVSPNSTGMDEA